MEYNPSQEDVEKIEEIFTFHPVQGDQGERYTEIRAAALEFGKLLLKFCPPSRERSLAITHLQEVVMFANASIAIHEDQ